MNGNKSHWILLFLALTVSASLMHEVIVHDNSTCTVCVQFHSSPPAIDNPNNGFVIVDNSIGTVLPTTKDTAVTARLFDTPYIRGPPQLIS